MLRRLDVRKMDPVGDGTFKWICRCKAEFKLPEPGEKMVLTGSVKTVVSSRHLKNEMYSGKMIEVITK